MFFGEIVEPSTRALIDDELEEYPEYTEPVVQWQGDPQVPHVIDNILVVESKKMIKLAKVCLLSNAELIASIKNGGLDIYGLENNNFVFIYQGEQTELLCGQVVEELSEWILKAKNIYTVISLPIAFYQTNNVDMIPVSQLRCLTNNPENNFTFNTKLEQPNLITGFGANILSYCIHLELKKCSLYVLYVDNTPLDSVSTKPLLDMFRHIGLKVKEDFKSLQPVDSSNLYM